MFQTISARLGRYWHNWKLITSRKLFYLPHILTAAEQRLFIAFIIIILASGGALFVRLYLAATQPIPDIGGTYTEGLLKEPRTINPLYASTDVDRDISRLVFSGLLFYDGSGQIQPDLAESYEVSQDATSYIIHLRKNAQWHDGALLDADDVIFTIKTIQNPQYKSPLRQNWQGVTAEKLDNHTVRFTLRAPYAPFIENLTTGIIPRHLWESVTPEQVILHELNLKPIGSGPYAFDRSRQEKDGSFVWYQLQRNDAYYLATGPYLNKIIFYFYKTDDDRLVAWRKNTIDGFGPIAPYRIPELKQEQNGVVSISTPRIFGIFFNQQKATILADKNVREAIAYALDRRAIAERATSGGAIPLEAPLPIQDSGSQQSVRSHDPAHARELLEKNGWTDDNGDGIREKTITSVDDKKRKETRVTPLQLTLTTSDWPDLLQTADQIKALLREVGIEVMIERKPFAELESSVIRPRNFEMLLFGQVYAHEADPFAFWHSSQIKDPGLNIALYTNREVDRLLEEARGTNDPLQRREKLAEFSRVLSEDIPAVFLFSQLYLYLLPTDMQGVHLTSISLPADRLNQVSQWYRETKRVFKR